MSNTQNDKTKPNQDDVNKTNRTVRPEQDDKKPNQDKNRVNERDDNASF